MELAKLEREKAQCSNNSSNAKLVHVVSHG